MSTIPPTDLFKKFFAHFPDLCLLVDEDCRILAQNGQKCGNNCIDSLKEGEAFCRTDLLRHNGCCRNDCPIRSALKTRQCRTIQEKHPRLGSIRIRVFPLDGEANHRPLAIIHITENTSQENTIAELANNLRQSEIRHRASREALLESERRYRHLAGHDPLTNLPNRSLLLDRLGKTMVYFRQTQRPLTIFFADLDRFKQINDSLGSDFGDRALCEMTRRLKNVQRNGDILARLNSDEFVLVSKGIGEHHNLCHLAQRLLALLRKPLTLSGHTVHLTASIGVACYRQGEESAEVLLRQADIAMCEAKRLGGNRYQFFSKKMQTRLEESFLLEKRMRKALEKREFFLYYQPQVDLASGRITGVEALARWGETPGVSISPEIFIKIAEDSGLIHQLGDFVLEEACSQNLRWQKMGLKPIQVTVNISARQFARSDFVEKVFAILEKSGLDPQWLELEITESTIMDNVVEAITTMNVLREAGVKFAIDDFGTGYSSLNYLRQLSLNKLKIDRSFMAGVPGDRGNEKLVTSILALARSFNLRTVAEGVETPGQLAYLRRIDCQLGQGFLFSRPVTPEIIADLLNTRFF